MQQGQILVNEDGEKRKILGVCGEVYFLSHINDLSNVADYCFTKKMIEELGWSPLEEPWNPGEDDAYWYVNFDGEIRRTEYRNWLVPSDEGHNFRLKIGNVHRTYEDAEAYKQKLIERMGSKN